MVKTTKILLIFLQTFEGNVGKKIFLGVCGKRGKPQRGHKAMAPLHTPRAFFKEFLVVVV